MKKILEPLQLAGIHGIPMTAGDGHQHRVHPLLACVAVDYPEQVLTTAVVNTQCAACPMPRDSLGAYTRHGPIELRDLKATLAALDSFDQDPGGFLQACDNAGTKPIIEPFWRYLPYVNIYRSITPDTLHQLYQGVVKHIVSWVLDCCGAMEIDARCRRLPPNHNIRLFMKGISTLSRVTGREHDQMAHILLGLVLEIRLPNNISAVRLVRSIRAVLDFLFLAQYPVHTSDTLELLEDALSRFHTNKDIFVDLGIREHFNLPKIHFMRHYVASIKAFGTLDNFNTEYTERLHIDLAKDAYRATNRKDEFLQMTIWLERKEKILRHEKYILWRLSGSLQPQPVDWVPPGIELGRKVYLSKHPSVRSVPLDRIVSDYGAIFFELALKRYISLSNNPGFATARQLDKSLWEVHPPFTKLPVWHRVKFLQTDAFTGETSTADSIHVTPVRRDRRGRYVPPRFDTALLRLDNEGNDAGENSRNPMKGR